MTTVDAPGGPGSASIGAGAEPEPELASAVVLDIGGDVGALVLYTPDALVGYEVEVSPTVDPDQRVHTVVRQRDLGPATVSAGVFPDLRAGDYFVHRPSPGRPGGEALERVTIVGGRVTEAVWT